MDPVKLDRLVVFRDVVELQGFSRAAQRRGLTHSTVSKHVRALEEELGVRLLHRTSRSMRLTEEGRVVYAASREVGDRVELLKEQLGELTGEVHGEVRVHSLLHVGAHIVEPAITRYLRRYPKVRVSLVLDDGPLQFTREGFDLAVRVGLAAEGSLTARKLLDNDVCFAASPALLERVGRPAHPRELAVLPTVAYEAGPVAITSWRYTEDDEVRTVDVDPVYRACDGNALQRAVLAGLGFGFLSMFAVREDLAAGRLVRVLPDFEIPPYAPVYLLDRGAPRPRRVTELRRVLLEVAAERA